MRCEGLKGDSAPGEEILSKMYRALDSSVKWIERLGDPEIDFDGWDGRNKRQRLRDTTDIQAHVWKGN